MQIHRGRCAVPCPRLPTIVIALLAAGLCAALLAACGASSGGASSPAASPYATSPAVPSASPAAAVGVAPTPVPSPQITSGSPPAEAVALARQYWRLLSDDRYAAARHLLSPTSPMQAGWPGTDAIVRAHLVRARGPVLVNSLGPSETVEFPVEIYVAPKYPVGNWGDPGVYVQYMGFVRMSDGSWRVMETGTGE
jgi:hypothetical protein